MKNKKLLLGLVGVIIAGIIVFSLWRKSGTNREQFIDIGVVLPLTGPASDIGQWQQKGLDLALKQINSQRGEGTLKLRLVYQDSAGDPKTGVSAFSQILSQSKPPIVISSISSVSNALLPVAQQQKVNVFMLAVSLPNITKQSEYAYRFNVGSEDEASIMARHISNRLKLNQIAVYYINDEFGLGALEVFKSEFGKTNGKIVWEEAYAKDAADHRNALSKMTKSNPQGIYVIGYTRASAIAIKQLREMGNKQPVFANMALTVPTFTSLIGEAMDGVSFTTNQFDANKGDEQVKRFAEAYQQSYNEQPTFFGAFAYDSLNVIAQAIKSEETAAADIKQALAPQKEFTGVMGKFSVDADRNFRFPVRLVQFTNGKLQELPE
jgi:branched-chain amino acid transport system substrate-binding protein